MKLKLRLTKSILRKKTSILINSDDEKKAESRIHITKIISEAADDNEPGKLSKPDDQTLYALGLFSDALENTETVSPDNLLNAHPVDNVVSIDEEASRSNKDPKKRTVEVSFFVFFTFFCCSTYFLIRPYLLICYISSLMGLKIPENLTVVIDALCYIVII